MFEDKEILNEEEEKTPEGGCECGEAAAEEKAEEPAQEAGEETSAEETSSEETSSEETSTEEASTEDEATEEVPEADEKSGKEDKPEKKGFFSFFRRIHVLPLILCLLLAVILWLIVVNLRASDAGKVASVVFPLIHAF